MFADYIFLVGENRKKVNQNLEVWRFTLYEKGLKISRSKRLYIV